MIKLLHFADAHIDMANYGRRDPETGLPLRVMDFLKSLDQIVDTAIAEQVDLVLFAGDTYRDRNPAPTFQREWGRRIMRLSQAKIPTLLLVGNHDLSPALGRAHALAEFNTLQVEQVRVLDKPQFLSPGDLWNLPVQVIALPWISRSGMMAQLDLRAGSPDEIYTQLEEKLTTLVQRWLDKADPNLPVILTAHASVQGAVYGGERTVMLGSDLVLSGSLVKNPQLDYVALGHIHKPQNLNKDAHPPVIYPGSIERVDFGEAQDQKFFVIAKVERGRAEVAWQQLKGIRRFVDRRVKLQPGADLESRQGISDQLRDALAPQSQLRDSIVRLVVEYPREWESLLDEAAIREYASEAFEFHLVKRPQMEARVRLPEGQIAGSISPLELLNLYWKTNHTDPVEIETLQTLAAEIITDSEAPA
ncbi:MAG TPA: exonuclease SbcCD subunit D [Anaerolineales bacterium]|nr:exonuclease SbcCD subunit D [Anaerolineales bacterium]